MVKGHNQCDQIGRFIALWASFLSLCQQLFSPNCHIFMQFVNSDKIFYYSSEIHFWPLYIDIWRLFSGHIGHNVATNNSFGLPLQHQINFPESVVAKTTFRSFQRKMSYPKFSNESDFVSVRCYEEGGNFCSQCINLEPHLGCGWCLATSSCTLKQICLVSYYSNPWPQDGRHRSNH